LRAYSSMRAPTNILILLVVFASASCNARRTNIESELVDQILGEFTTERALHYLHGSGPKSNAEIMERVLKRHSLRLIEFSPALKRFQPQIFQGLLGESAARR